MRAITLKHYNYPAYARALLCTAAMLAVCLSAVSGLWLALTGALMAAVFVIALENDRSLSCGCLMLSHNGLLAVYHKRRWYAVTSWKLLRLFKRSVELSVQIEGRGAVRYRIRLSENNFARTSEYVTLRHYLLSSNRRAAGIKKRNPLKISDALHTN